MKKNLYFRSVKAIFLSILIGLSYFTKTQAAENDGIGGNITHEDFNSFNPLVQANNGAGGDPSLVTPGGIISKMLEFAFPLAGVILFVMLFWGGFEILYGSSTSKSMESGKNRITGAIIGFFLLFSSFWIIQIIEIIFGITIFL